MPPVAPEIVDAWPWYWWVVGAGLFAAADVATVLQRDFSVTVLVAVGAMIGSVALLVVKKNLPPEIYGLTAIVAVAVLLTHPAHADAAPFILVLTIGLLASEVPAARSVPFAVAAAGVPVFWNLEGRFDSSLLWVAAIVAGELVGIFAQNLVRLNAELREAQAGLATQAATDERRRIAREVHDVIAHSLTVTMLHVTGARMALEANDPDDAAAALRDAEQHGRASLAEIRRTVGLLADGDGPRDATAAPEPGASDIPELVAGYASAGLDVQLQVSGDLATLTPTAGLNLYRIVQEGLANAVKHAPGAPARVEITVGPETRLMIRNPAPPNRTPRTDKGHGLTGMHERAAMLGARLRAGRDGGDWLVEVTT